MYWASRQTQGVEHESQNTLIYDPAGTGCQILGYCASQNLLESSYEKSYDEQRTSRMIDLTCMPTDVPSAEGVVSLADFLSRPEESSLLDASRQVAKSS